MYHGRGGIKMTSRDILKKMVKRLGEDKEQVMELFDNHIADLNSIQDISAIDESKYDRQAEEAAAKIKKMEDFSDITYIKRHIQSIPLLHIKRFMYADMVAILGSLKMVEAQINAQIKNDLN